MVGKSAFVGVAATVGPRSLGHNLARSNVAEA